MGDPDQIYPYTNLYEVQLVIADQRLREPVRWNFAKFNIKFKKYWKKKPPSELDYNYKPVVKYTP